MRGSRHRKHGGAAIHAAAYIAVIMPVFIILLTSGCGRTPEQDTEALPRDDARERSVFWQMAEPEVQLDPVEEKEYPGVFVPRGEDEPGSAR